MFRKGKGNPPQAALKTHSEGFNDVSKLQTLHEVKQRNQPYRPAADHPFRRAFSPRRMSAPDCNTRRPPLTPVSRRDGNTAKLPWHLRPLPDDWDADEQLFFRNWMRELARLHDTLMSTAGDRAKLLRRARNIYFKLAHRLNGQKREPATQARGDAVKAVRQ